MLKIHVDRKEDKVFAKISGSFIDQIDLGKHFGDGFKELHLKCRGLVRINSIGTRLWLAYFQMLRKQNVQVYLVECSTFLVSQMNMMKSFCEGMIIESIMVPFICTQCQDETSALFSMGELKAIRYAIEDRKCEKCGGVAEFDDITQEYFGFLR